MAAWFEEYFGADWAPIAMWSAVALASLVLLLLVYWIVRRMFSGTFVAGGRGRRPRLAVLDAAAVDSRRRLVLIRRDETEHLILIGGPTDVVIEQGIRHQTRELQSEKSAAPAAIVKPADAGKTAPSPKAEIPRAAEPAPEPPSAAPEKPRERPAETTIVPPATVAMPPREPVAARPAAAASTPLPTERERGVMEPQERAAGRFASAGAYSSSTSAPAPQPAATPAVARTASGSEVPAAIVSSEKGDLDSALLRELEATLDRPKAASSRSTSIEDDMAKMIADMERERV